MVWLEGRGPAVVLIVFLIRSFLLQSKQELQAEKKDRTQKNKLSKQ